VELLSKVVRMFNKEEMLDAGFWLRGDAGYSMPDAGFW
jgi:hypothetical protein